MSKPFFGIKLIQPLMRDTVIVSKTFNSSLCNGVAGCPCGFHCMWSPQEHQVMYTVICSCSLTVMQMIQLT